MTRQSFDENTLMLLLLYAVQVVVFVERGGFRVGRTVTRLCHKYRKLILREKKVKQK